MIRAIDRAVMLFLTLLSVALLTLWLRSHIVGDAYRWSEMGQSPDGRLVLQSGRIWTGEGGVALVTQTHVAHDDTGHATLRRRAERRARWAPNGHARLEPPTYPIRTGDGVLAPLGVDFDLDQRFDGSVQRNSFGIGLPLWLLIIVAAGYPMFRFIRGVMQRERQERIILGLCPRCGVDVRQGPPRCPCCGKRQPLLLPQRLAA